MSESTPLHYLSISQAAKLIEKRELSVVELTEAHLRRVAALNDRLHAFITVTADEALETARGADRDIAAGHYRGALHGIPIAHKDIVWTMGVRTTAHSRLLEQWIPEEDATVYVRLQEAGAISLGKTALAEFAYGVTDETAPFPAACNPGASSTRRAVRAADRVRRSPRVCAWERPAPIRAARSAIPPPCARSSV